MNETFESKLQTSAEASGSWLCVGLDPVLERLPSGCERTPAGAAAFCRDIIEATSPHACAFKPNMAFFEAFGDEGWPALREVLAAVPPQIPVILDAKRGDVGHTARQYAEAYFGQLDVDAVTLSPYLGWDAVEPFAMWPGKAAIVLCLTSNDSADEVQAHDVGGKPLFVRIAEMVNHWPGTCGLVVGATRAEALQEVRTAAPEKVILLPGVGAQGGDLETSVRLGARANGGGLLVNVSRGVLYASDGEDYASAAALAAERMKIRIADAAVV